MAYIRDNARFTVLDDIPADVWQETSPRAYLCIVGEEPHDYYGSFAACVYTSALYRGEHVGASPAYLATCALAPEDTARRILAHYLRQWASLENEDTAALLLEEAERIASAPMFDAIRDTRERYHANAETLTFTSGAHGTRSDGTTWTAAPGYGASIYTTDSGAVVATVGETWKPTSFDDCWCLINQTRRKFATREEARKWAREQATAHGYPEQTARPAFDLFTV